MNEYSCKLSELKELPYVMFILFFRISRCMAANIPHMLGLSEKLSFQVNGSCCKLSELQELCLTSPYVMFIFFELVGVRQLLYVPFVCWDGPKKLLIAFKVNEYSCKLSKVKELCRC